MKLNKGKRAVCKFFGYYGSKRRMVAELQAIVPEHTVYLEPFVGSGALLLNKERSPVEIVNDLDAEIANIFSVMADREKGKKFMDKVASLEYSRELFVAVRSEKKSGYACYNDVERAVMEFFLLTASYNATRKTFAEKGLKSAEEYRRRVGKFLPEIYERLAGVSVFNMDALELIPLFADREDAFIFLDPPYLKSLRGKNAGNVYGCEMSETMHESLLNIIKRARAKICICGYREEEQEGLYDKILLPEGWSASYLGDFRKTCQKKQYEDYGSEYVWTNFKMPVQKQ